MKERLKQAIRARLSNERNQEGITLIELLAVIVILAVIAAIAVPVVLGSISKSKVSVTQQNMSVIVEALNRYATDHNGTYPKATTPTDAQTALSSLLDTNNNGNGYLKTIPNDGWGQHFKYYSSTGSSFYLQASQSDGGTTDLWINSTMASPSNSGTANE
jgi:type II secretion system protein G